MMARRALAALVAAALLATSPARADGPEQLDQLEPGKGELQIEYFGAYGGEDTHGLEALFGVTDRLALGLETEIEAGVAEGAALIALYRFRKAGAGGPGAGVAVQLGLDREGGVGEIEGRLILEERGARWWGQADMILRHRREAGDAGTGLAYGWSLSRAVSDRLWLGIEASGQLSRLGGESALAPEGQHYAGPALTLEQPIGDSEAEIGLAWMQRVRGQGPASGPRLFVQMSF